MSEWHAVKLVSRGGGASIRGNDPWWTWECPQIAGTFGAPVGSAVELEYRFGGVVVPTVFANVVGNNKGEPARIYNNGARSPQRGRKVALGHGLPITIEVNEDMLVEVRLVRIVEVGNGLKLRVRKEK